MMSMDDLQIVLPMTLADPNPSRPFNEAVMIIDENGVQHFQGQPGFEIPPDIAVEVLSPGDRRKNVREKIKDYVKNDVKLVWLVDPDTRTVTVYQGSLRGSELDEADTLTGGDVLPGFTCLVSDLFD